VQVAASNRLDSMVQRQLAKRIKDARHCDWQPGVGLLRHVAAMLPPTATPEQLWSLLASGSAAAPSRAAGGGGGGGGGGVGGGSGVDVGGGSSGGGGGGGEAEGPAAGVSTPPAAPTEPGAFGGRSLLVGLHTCGDLACTMLRVFHSGVPDPNPSPHPHPSPCPKISPRI